VRDPEPEGAPEHGAHGVHPALVVAEQDGRVRVQGQLAAAQCLELAHERAAQRGQRARAAARLLRVARVVVPG